MAKLLETITNGSGLGADAVAVGVDYTTTGSISTDKKLNYAAQATADGLSFAATYTLGPVSLGAGALAAVGYLAALGTNTAVLADDLGNTSAPSSEKTLSIVGDILTEVGDIVGHWACLANFVSKTTAVPYENVALTLTVGGMTISGLTLANNAIPPAVNAIVQTGKTALANAQGLVSSYQSLVIRCKNLAAMHPNSPTRSRS